MKIYYTTTLLLLIFLISGIQISKAQDTQEQSLKSIIKDVSILASDSLQGRQSGLPSVKKSINYIEQRYKEIGLTTFPMMDN
ncbi:MAG: hypothetical protein C0599_04390 [Salinivirgaceae bacterium]|nr:MAG: hypothetical protein C0599_04390 [Salinivirgaceae bacterium]